MLMCEASRMINSNSVKYERMNSLIHEIKKYNKNKMFVYFDMYSIVKSLYQENVTIEDYTIVTSCIINMAAHYRSYFNLHNIETAFFIIYCENYSYLNTQLISGYNKSNYEVIHNNPKVHDMVMANVNLLKTLCPYLPDIAFIDRGNNETGVIIADIMMKYDVNDQFYHLILSKDDYIFQLVSIKDSVFVLRPKKLNGVDESYLIHNDNLIEYYLKYKKCTYETKVSAGLYSVLLTLNGCKSRNIKSIMNTQASLKEIEKLIDNNIILNAYNSNPIFIFNNLSKISPQIAMSRFNSIDLFYQLTVYKTLSPSKYPEIINLYNPDEVKHLNNEFFKSNPLDVNRL